jgi:hypothetical protein
LLNSKKKLYRLPFVNQGDIVWFYDVKYNHGTGEPYDENKYYGFVSEVKDENIIELTSFDGTRKSLTMFIDNFGLLWGKA